MRNAQQVLVQKISRDGKIISWKATQVAPTQETPDAFAQRVNALFQGDALSRWLKLTEKEIARQRKLEIQRLYAAYQERKAREKHAASLPLPAQKFFLAGATEAESYILAQLEEMLRPGGKLSRARAVAQPKLWEKRAAVLEMLGRKAA